VNRYEKFEHDLVEWVTAIGIFAIFFVLPIWVVVLGILALLKYLYG